MHDMTTETKYSKTSSAIRTSFTTITALKDAVYIIHANVYI